MAAPTVEAPKGKTEEAKAAENGKASKNGKHEEAKPAENGKATGEEKAAAAPSGGGGGKLKAFIPLIATVVVMPLLAFATTRYVLLPKLTKGIAQAEGAPAPATAPAPTPSDASTDGKTDGKAADKIKSTVQINKLLVNVAGTMGTRYLMTSITLVGNTPDFPTKINDNLDQLKDLATGCLSSKTISDLEKPGARNVIRAELISVFNSALGAPLVQEMYITEMAIQ